MPLQAVWEDRLAMSSERRRRGKLVESSWNALSIQGLLLGRRSDLRFRHLARMWARSASSMLQSLRRSDLS